MRILYHHRTQAEDGQAVHIRALIGAFARAGHEVREVGLVRQADGAQRSRWAWVTRAPRFVQELAEYAYTPFARDVILREAARFEPDFLYERYAFGNAGGVLAARRLGVPLVLEVNSPLVLELSQTRGLAFPRAAARLEDFIFGAADRVCVVTQVLKRMLVERGVAAERVILTPNGVHLEAYEYGDRRAARARAREDLGLAAERARELCLGFVGYFRDWHRLDLVLEAMRARGLEAARLVLVGEGPARGGLEARARELGLGPRLHFCGPRGHADVPRLLPAFDVALLPAINPYASPLKLHEYMAASLPVIAADQQNLREILAHGENAWLVPSGDAQALAQAILALARDEGLRARLGRAARRKVEELDLTWAGNVRRVLAAVESARPSAKDAR